MDEQGDHGKTHTEEGTYHTVKKHSMWRRDKLLGKNIRILSRICSGMTRKADAHLELNLAKDVKDKMRAYLNKTETTGRLVKMWAHCWMGWVFLWERIYRMHNNWLLHFTTKASPHYFHTPGARERVWWKIDFLLVEEDQVRDHLGKPDTHKS